MRRLSEIVFRQSPLTLAKTETVRAACRLMGERRAGSVVVVDGDDRLVGIFTARDAVRRVVAGGRDPASTTLNDVMTPNPTVMAPSGTAIEALRLMWDGGFRHVPVVDGARLLGVASRGDFDAEEVERLEDERAFWEHLR